MSLDPPKVMLEHSFLAAVADPGHDHHELCRGAYLHLVREYEHQRVLLVAVSDDLRAFDLGDGAGDLKRSLWFLRRPRSAVFAPVDPLHVGWQHRRAAVRMNEVPAGQRLTLVMCERHKVRRIATIDPAFAEYDLHVEPLSDRAERTDAGETVEDLPATDAG